MLELKDICKTYKSKKGAQTQALKDVSLSFPDKGLVFVLGKSGCGKSTLLNVIGGLDKPDSGEISIMGRSSKDFSGTDFDSYRNTFVGFVFQEYNILNEFTVEDNIAIASELQGKKRDRALIKEILGCQKSAAYSCRRAYGLARFRYGQGSAQYFEKAFRGKAGYSSIPRQRIRRGIRRPYS